MGVSRRLLIRLSIREYDLPVERRIISFFLIKTIYYRDIGDDLEPV